MNNIVTDKPKAYKEAVINFLNDLEPEKVKSLCLVALCDGEVHDVVCTWKAGPFELMMAASSLQLHAGRMYNKINSEEFDDEG
jgi:hypothetical protein